MSDSMERGKRDIYVVLSQTSTFPSKIIKFSEYGILLMRGSLKRI